MLSMFKDDHGKTILNVTNCDKISDVKIVEMKNLGLLDFDHHMFNQMTNIEELDVSGNCLDNIPESIKLHKLKKLNCGRNKFSDVMFVQQFPCLEEVDFTGNDITFPDFCIASVLCPTLKRINNQNIDFKALNSKMETRLKPVINQVWAKYFAPLYAENMSNEAFECLSEKFRIMLKHANVQTTKLVTKFKDFKLLQLIDQFLEDVRTKPGHGRILSKKYQRSSLDTLRDSEGVAPEIEASNATGTDYPFMVILNDDGSSEIMEGAFVISESEVAPEVNGELHVNKSQSQVFGVDEDAESVETSKTSQINENKTTDLTISKKDGSEAKVKYWLYDGKAAPKKKDTKPQPSRKSRGSLKRYIVGSVGNNSSSGASSSSKKTETLTQSKVQNKQLGVTKSADKTDTFPVINRTLNASRSSATCSKEPVAKRVRFVDEEIGKKS